MTDLRTYASLHTAKKAISKAGLDALYVRYDEISGKRIQPVVLCDLVEDQREAIRRGFKAEHKPLDFCVGATVYVKDSVAVAKRGELAVISRFLDTIGEVSAPGAVYLDRPIGGTRWWNISDLGLVVREVD